jgi:hypothetical protein
VQGDDGARVDAGHQRPGGEGEAGPEAQREERIYGQEVCYCCSSCPCFIDVARCTVLQSHSISTSSSS